MQVRINLTTAKNLAVIQDHFHFVPINCVLLRELEGLESTEMRFNEPGAPPHRANRIGIDCRSGRVGVSLDLHDQTNTRAIFQ